MNTLIIPGSVSVLQTHAGFAGFCTVCAIFLSKKCCFLQFNSYFDFE